MIPRFIRLPSLAYRQEKRNDDKRTFSLSSQKNVIFPRFYYWSERRSVCVTPLWFMSQIWDKEKEEKREVLSHFLSSFLLLLRLFFLLAKNLHCELLRRKQENFASFMKGICRRCTGENNSLKMSNWFQSKFIGIHWSISNLVVPYLWCSSACL